jgi:UDP-glucose 4-epimerase
VIDAVRRVTERDPRIETGERRGGDATRLVASSEKARRLLGWEARRSGIDTIIADAWRWYLAHPNGYAK